MRHFLRPHHPLPPKNPISALYTGFELFCSWGKFDILFHILFGYTVSMFALDSVGDSGWSFLILYILSSVAFSVLGWMAVRREGGWEGGEGEASTSLSWVEIEFRS